MNEHTILLVEDNISDIELTRRALHKSCVPCHLVVKEDGLDALVYLMEDCSDAGSCLPSLVLLDLKLPRMEGLELLKEIKMNPRTKRVPVVILTSSAETEDIRNSYNLGANSYIRKPVDFNQFLEVFSVLERYWLQINESGQN